MRLVKPFFAMTVKLGRDSVGILFTVIKDPDSPHQVIGVIADRNFLTAKKRIDFIFVGMYKNDAGFGNGTLLLEKESLVNKGS
jgi:hypothetical protein